MPNEITSFQRVTGCDIELSAYFSALKINGEIYFGTYGYQNEVHNSKLFKYPKEEVASFNAESVFYMLLFKGKYYLSLEHGLRSTVNRAMIYRLDGTTWIEVYRHPSRELMLYMWAHTDGYLYATTGTIVVRSYDGINWNEYIGDETTDAYFAMTSLGGDLYIGACTDPPDNMYKPVVYKNTVADWTYPGSPSGKEAFWSAVTFNGDMYFGTYIDGSSATRVMRYSDKVTVLSRSGKGGILSLLVDTVANTLFAFICSNSEDTGSSEIWSTKDGSTWTQIYGTGDSPFLGPCPYFDPVTGHMWIPGGRVNRGGDGYGRIYRSIRAADIDGYILCANENESYALSSVSDVAYGANNQFYYLYNQTGTIVFNNATFGDPIPGVVKFGYYRPVSLDTLTVSSIVHNTYSDVPTLSQPNPAPIAYVSQYPPVFSETYVKATTRWTDDEGVGQYYYPHFAVDPSKPLTGAIENVIWISTNGVTTNQRFHMDLGSGKIIKRVYYQNIAGVRGINQFTLWGSNDANAFANLTYGVDTNWTQLAVSQNTFDSRVSNDVADPKYILVTNEASYRYYAFKFANARADEFFMGVWRIELQIQVSGPVLAVNNSIINTYIDHIVATENYEEFQYTTQYPPAFSSIYVKATSRWTEDEGIGEYYYPWFSVDPYKSTTGSHTNNAWVSENGSTINQRFHIDLGIKKIIRRIRYENGVERGVYNFTFWGSNSAAAFEELNYGVNTDWVQLETSQSTFDQHTILDIPDPKYILVNNSVAYRYYAFKFADTRANVYFMSVRRIELQIRVEEIPDENEPFDPIVSRGLEPQIWSTDLIKRNAVDETKHQPCGHWHKFLEEVTTGCLSYRNQLDTVSGEVGPRSMKVLSDRFLYCFHNGANAASEFADKAILRKIDSETLGVVKLKEYETADIYKIWDILEIGGAIWIIVETGGNYSGPGYRGSWVYRINMTTLEIIDKRIYCDTYTNPEKDEYGNLLDPRKFYAIASEIMSYENRPGNSQWATAWALLPDSYTFHVSTALPTTERMQPAIYHSFVSTGEHILVAPHTTPYWGITKYTLNGEKVGHLSELNSTISNLVISSNKVYAAVFVTAQYMHARIIRISDMVPLEGPDYEMLVGWALNSSSIIWHRNGFIYSCMKSWYQDDVVGVVKYDQKGAYVTSYTYQDTGGPALMGKIIATNENIFWWQGKLGDGTVGGIVKLDLNLNFICVEPFHFISADSPPFGETAIFQESAEEVFALAIREERRLLYYHGIANHYTQWYYY